MVSEELSGYIIGIPTVLFSFLSFWAAIYICASAFMMKKLRDNKIHHLSNDLDNKYFWERPTLITHHIFWMSFCDSLISIYSLIIWFPILLGYNNINNDYFLNRFPSFCSILGGFAQFSFTGSIIWFFLVSINLFSIVFGFDTPNFAKAKKRNTFIAWFISFINTIIPLFNNKYGSFINNTNIIDINKFEYNVCWIVNENYWLTILIPVGITMLFSFFLLIWILTKYYCNRNMDNTDTNIFDKNNDISTEYSLYHPKYYCMKCFERKNSSIFNGIDVQDSLIASRLTAFTLIFISVWLPPYITRMYQLINKKSPKLFLTAIHHYCISLIGCTNAYVWINSRNFHGIIKSYRGIIAHNETQTSSMMFTSIHEELNMMNA